VKSESAWRALCHRRMQVTSRYGPYSLMDPDKIPEERVIKTPRSLNTLATREF